MPNILRVRFRDVDLADPFFDSLKESYQEFDDWFHRKSEEEAYILRNDQGQLRAFVYLKIEHGPVTDITPPLNTNICLKIGTFKIDAHGTRLGERFVKKIFDTALHNNVRHIYVTVFPEHVALIEILTRYGFIQYGSKTTANGEELVFLKDFERLQGDIRCDYPVIDARGKNKWLLSIYPRWHTQLFPDSILANEDARIVNDLSHTNSIHKVYISWMEGLGAIRPGDCIVIYRTAEEGRAAEHTSVATSICVVEEIRARASFRNENDFIEYCRRNSVFNEAQLRGWYLQQGRNEVYVIRMTYNVALNRRPNRRRLIEDAGLERNIYWGFFQIPEQSFSRILELGEVNEGIVIN